jgi:uncharacterized protein YdaU (DUF1376 family)
MNFYKRHIGDYLKDTAHLSLLEHGVYGRLLDVYYTRESGIPESQAGRLIGARSKDETTAVHAVLTEFFELVDGTWIQARCEAEIAAASTKIDANRENGKKGGRPKKTKPTTEPTENPTGLPTENPLGFGSATQNNLSQTPDSRLQTPDLKAALTVVPSPQAEETSSALPELQSTLTPEQRAAVPVVTKLRSLGVTITSANPLASEWVGRGLTLERVQEVVEFARLKGKPEGPIHPNFINALLDDALNPPAPKPKKDDWHRTDEGISRKAKELRVSARAGWSYAQLKDAVWEEIRRVERQGATA